MSVISTGLWPLAKGPLEGYAWTWFDQYSPRPFCSLPSDAQQFLRDDMQRAMTGELWTNPKFPSHVVSPYAYRGQDEYAYYIGTARFLGELVASRRRSPECETPRTGSDPVAGGRRRQPRVWRLEDTTTWHPQNGDARNAREAADQKGRNAPRGCPNGGKPPTRRR